MRETWDQSLGREDPLKKRMATHSSILAWRIPWIEEPGRLQPVGSQTVGHNWVISLSLFSFHTLRVGFPGDTEVKKPPANVVNSLIPGSGRSSGGGNGNPLHYSYLENPMGRGACGLLSMGLQNSWTWLKWLSSSSSSMLYKSFCA